MIEYVKDSKPREDGWYLVRVQWSSVHTTIAGLVLDELEIAKYDLKFDNWDIAGIDYDAWQHSSCVHHVEVVTKLDLAKIAAASRDPGHAVGN